MLRKIVIFSAVLIVGLIASQDLFITDSEMVETLNADIKNGDLSIVSTVNNKNEILHIPDEYEVLKPIEDVSGLIHYNIGARIHSK